MRSEPRKLIVLILLVANVIFYSLLAFVNCTGKTTALPAQQPTKVAAKPSEDKVEQALPGEPPVVSYEEEGGVLPEIAEFPDGSVEGESEGVTIEEEKEQALAILEAYRLPTEEAVKDSILTKYKSPVAEEVRKDEATGKMIVVYKVQKEGKVTPEAIFEWEVDLESKEIAAKNEDAKSLLESAEAIAEIEKLEEERLTEGGEEASTFISKTPSDPFKPLVVETPPQLTPEEEAIYFEEFPFEGEVVIGLTREPIIIPTARDESRQPEIGKVDLSPVQAQAKVSRKQFKELGAEGITVASVPEAIAMEKEIMEEEELELIPIYEEIEAEEVPEAIAIVKPTLKEVEVIQVPTISKEMVAKAPIALPRPYTTISGLKRGIAYEKEAVEETPERKPSFLYPKKPIMKEATQVREEESVLEQPPVVEKAEIVAIAEEPAQIVEKLIESLPLRPTEKLEKSPVVPAKTLEDKPPEKTDNDEQQLNLKEMNDKPQLKEEELRKAEDKSGEELIETLLKTPLEGVQVAMLNTPDNPEAEVRADVQPEKFDMKVRLEEQLKKLEDKSSERSLDISLDKPVEGARLVTIVKPADKLGENGSSLKAAQKVEKLKEKPLNPISLAEDSPLRGKAKPKVSISDKSTESVIKIEATTPKLEDKSTITLRSSEPIEKPPEKEEVGVIKSTMKKGSEDTLMTKSPQRLVEKGAKREEIAPSDKPAEKISLTEEEERIASLRKIASQFRLAGVVVDEQSTLAIIETSERVYILREGETIGTSGFVIADITADKVTLIKSGYKYILELGGEGR